MRKQCYQLRTTYIRVLLIQRLGERKSLNFKDFYCEWICCVQNPHSLTVLTKTTCITFLASMTNLRITNYVGHPHYATDPLITVTNDTHLTPVISVGRLRFGYFENGSQSSNYLLSNQTIG